MTEIRRAYPALSHTSSVVQLAEVIQLLLPELSLEDPRLTKGLRTVLERIGERLRREDRPSVEVLELTLAGILMRVVQRERLGDYLYHEFLTLTLFEYDRFPLLRQPSEALRVEAHQQIAEWALQLGAAPVAQDELLGWFGSTQVPSLLTGGGPGPLDPADQQALLGPRAEARSHEPNVPPSVRSAWLSIAVLACASVSWPAVVVGRSLMSGTLVLSLPLLVVFVGGLLMIRYLFHTRSVGAPQLPDPVR